MTTKEDTTYRNIIDRLKSVLLDSTNYIGLDLLNKSVDNLGETLKCTECSLWSVNNNNHRRKKNEKPFVSTSLIHRWINNAISKDITDTLNHREDFVHEIEKGTSLFNEVMDIANITLSDETTSRQFLRCDKAEAKHRNYRSPEFLNSACPNDFIAIPIKSKEDCKVTIAILEFSFLEKKYSDNEWNEMTSILKLFFSGAFHRNSMIHKQNMTAEIVKRHIANEEKGAFQTFKSIVDLFANITCPSHAASFFMWDTHQYRYNLIYTTTDLRKEEKKKAYYERGKGNTGIVAQKNEALVLDNVKVELGEEHKPLLPEMDPQKMETAMIIPIPRISKKKEVIGILRFINKKNVSNNKHIDYYNDRDVEIIQSASNYLALTIDHFIKEEEQRNFIDKLSHELLTPAASIRKSAGRILYKKDDVEFNNTHLYPYVSDIFDAAENQIWQVKTNLHQTKEVLRSPFDARKYDNQIIYLSDILKKSKQIVRPIARKKGVLFDNIMPEELFTGNPLRLKVDKDAFITVFYNLFTNAIKYNDPKSSYAFFVDVTHKVTQNGIIIEVKDYGIGINEKEKESVFLMGYRGINAIESERGFGVGLTTVKQIIEDYGGTIEVTSFKNPTKFTITLPSKLISYE